MTADERLALIRRKIEWAEAHAKNLEAIRDGFIQSKPYTVGSEPDLKPGHEGLHRYFPTSIKDVDPRIALIAGDIIHNLRSALDHLACQLVEVAGNSITDQTMFPIAKGDSINEPSFSGKVKGMRKAAQDKIRSAEPYKGGKGHDLWVLHKLDIADKHHALLTTINRVGEITITLEGSFLRGNFRVPTPRFAAPNFGDALEVGKPYVTCEPEEYEKMQITFDVAISEPGILERKPIVWAMNYLIRKVDSLIIEFEPLLA
jgi:hypothetical protein